MEGMGRKLKVNLLYGYTAKFMHVLPTFCICIFSMWFLTYKYNQNGEFMIWVSSWRKNLTGIVIG